MNVIPCIHPGKQTFNLIEIDGEKILYADCKFCNEIVNLQNKEIPA